MEEDVVCAAGKLSNFFFLFIASIVKEFHSMYCSYWVSGLGNDIINTIKMGILLILIEY